MSAQTNQPLTDTVSGPSDLPADRNQALNALFTLYYADLVRLARVLVDDHESAEDVVMDAFVGLQRRWSALRDIDKAQHYLRRAVLNGSRSRLRRRLVVRRRAVTPACSATSSAEESVVLADDQRSLVQRLRQLPTRQRQVLVLRYYIGLSEAEIAEELGISRGSVKTHASRGLAALTESREDLR